MALARAAMDAKIEQPAPERIVVVEGGGAARVLGVVALVGGSLLALRGGDLPTIVFGAVLALFGGALATQRCRLVLDRAKGLWTQGADVFFVIPFRNSGLLAELGSVEIHRETHSTPGEHTRRSTFVSYPVRVPARTTQRNDALLRFGSWETREEADAMARPLAQFLQRPVEDRSQPDR